MKELKVTNDYVFKRIFGRPENKEILKDLLISILEIPKCTTGKIKNKLDVWIRFIGNIKEEGEEEMSYKIDEETKKALNEAKRILNDLNADPEERRLAELREKAIVTEIMSLEGARVEGEKEGKIKIAKKMKIKRFAMQDIMDITGLTKEEIEIL